MDTQPIAAPSIGRSSNTVFGSLKWWPSSNNSNSSRTSASSTSSSGSGNGNASTTSSATGSAVVASCHSLPTSPSSSGSSSSALNSSGGIGAKPLHFGSAANVGSSASVFQLQHRQKLRESKWFTVDESRVLCAVVEPGFVVEIREGQENESAYGVVQFKASKDKKPKPQDVDVFTIKATSATTAATSGRLQRVVRRSLADLWLRGCTVRIHNFGDREHQPHSEKDIRNQIAFAQKAKQMLWQSSQHFAFWCRYGERQEDIRRKQVDAMRYKFPLGIVH